MENFLKSNENLLGYSFSSISNNKNYMCFEIVGSLVNNGGLGSNWLRKGIPNVTCNIVLGTKSAILLDEARLRLE